MQRAEANQLKHPSNWKTQDKRFPQPLNPEAPKLLFRGSGREKNLRNRNKEINYSQSSSSKSCRCEEPTRQVLTTVYTLVTFVDGED